MVDRLNPIGMMSNDEHNDETMTPDDAPDALRERGLARTISKAGYGTRRQAEEMVRSGRVQVAGKRVLDPTFSVTENLEIRIDDQPISELIRTYLAFHKPLDVATTATVSHSTQLISQHLPTDITGLSPGGRLDTSTSGLLLVSNDSEWNAMAASGNGHDKEFLLKIAGHVTEVELGIIRAGVQVPKVGEVKPRSIDVIEDNGHICRVNLVLREGKVRQIRNLFMALRLDLEAVHRIRIGPIRLDSLAAGCWRSLSQDEIESIRKGAS